MGFTQVWHAASVVCLNKDQHTEGHFVSGTEMAAHNGLHGREDAI